jgi:hypothetical protein
MARIRMANIAQDASIRAMVRSGDLFMAYHPGT